MNRHLTGLIFCFLTLPSLAQPFHLPTANRALYEKNGEDKYFAGTTDKPWTSGTFGCVRTDGWQLHEGLDIRSIERDRRGEPVDPVHATFDGVVAYINRRPALSNYGNYIILRHRIEGIEVYSLYAHLHEVRADLQAGHAVKTGEAIATMGRTTNTRERISKERAHVHFELDFLINDRFASWYPGAFPGQKNDHGEWNGQNLLGIDPRLLLLAENTLGTNFQLRTFLQQQPELCRVTVRARDFPWVKRYPSLVTPNPVAEREGIAGYELALNYNGLPFRLIPRAASELKQAGRYHLISVNAEEQKKNPCRRLVRQAGTGWELGRNGIRLLDLLTY